MRRIVILGCVGLALSACATRRDRADVEPDVDVAGPASVDADLLDASGRRRASATASQSGDSIRVRIEAFDMAPGAYGAHLHTTGRCDAPAFAGAHWNPTSAKHGKDNPAGMHKGDLPNLLVGTDGRGSFEYTIPNATVSGRGPNLLLDGDGASVVIHASPDDFRTDPSGNSGARMACGVLD
jgi:Cu-Zn family superoxide dismutase